MPIPEHEGQHPAGRTVPTGPRAPVRMPMLQRAKERLTRVPLSVSLLIILAVLLSVLFIGNPWWQASSPPQATVAATVARPATTARPSQSPITTVTPDVAATQTEVNLEEFMAGAPPGAFSDPVYAAAATETVRHWNQYLTETALTPTHTAQPTTDWPSPAPTATFFVGMLTDMGCARVPAYGAAPQFNSCWRTLLDGQWYLVAGGWDDYDGPAPSLLQHSLLEVCLEPCPSRVGRDRAVLYRPPWNVGDLRIVDIAAGLVTVEPRDPAQHAVFVFDIARRQWLPPAATPTP